MEAQAAFLTRRRTMGAGQVTDTTRTGSGPDASDVFINAYLAGTPARLPTPAAAEQPRGPQGVGGAGEGDTGTAPSRAAPMETIALGGQLLTSNGPIRGWLTIEGGLITDITTRKPSGARSLTTDGVILSGLIDLHGHPEFNVFAPWEPPRTFVNRYAWRDSAEYSTLIREPQNRLLSALPSETQLRYAEIRALVGGATAIQGASGRTQGTDEFLVRNVDRNIFSQHHARTLIDLPASLTSWGGDGLQAILDGITSGDVNAFYVHLAEGQRSNQRSIDEFDHLVSMNGLTTATIIIHGSALTRTQLGQAADAGAKLVWSPQSNLRLYGETTRAGDALDVGLPVGLGADWLPSGSTSLLAEMKVARQELANQNHPITASELVAMVTTRAAQIAGLGDKLGSLEIGRPADVLVLARTDPEPYESVCAATPNDVELVLIGGHLAYGRADWIHTLAENPADPNLEPVLAWGRPMLLDTSYQGQPDGDPTPRLTQLRTDLTSNYPPVGPIWA
jgi:5-methylthioadenosine/S-adenosylhomocysteine deaminase